MAYAPAALVESIPRLALPYGLLSVLTPRGNGAGRWENGVEWETLGCAPASGIGQPDCEPGAEGETTAEGLPKSFGNGVPVGEATAFTVYGSHVCSPVGNTPEQAETRARAHLAAREEARAEQAFWTGDLGNTPNLQDDAVEVTTAAASPAEALAALEDFIATEYGSLGVIHMTRGAATVLIGKSLVVASGASLKTVLGTPVVAGAGYPGTSPTGAAPAAGETWVYGSPALAGYRSDIFSSDSQLDRDTNDLYSLAERRYLIGYDPCGVGAAQMTLE